ncbi:MAG: HD-GYP domain-containing protein [Lachnospiraceae bacterium]|nr:HD-GYP domain-containing protein [Lachnospiraceae bacterium]
MGEVQVVKTSRANAKMIVAEDVYSFSGQLIINAGTVLTDKIITRLRFYSINEIKVEVPEQNKPEKKSIFKHKRDTWSQKVRSTETFKEFSKDFGSAVIACKSQLTSIVSDNKDIDFDSLTSNITGMIEKSSTPSSLFDMLQCLRQFNDVIFVHAVNVAMISYILASWIKMPKNELKVLLEAALLHDIGKIQIPQEIVNKPQALTKEEFETMKQHATFGYNILKSKNVDDRIKLAAFSHHERCDGTGYPLGLTNELISPFAKIIAIADVYDAMTSTRLYREPVCPLDVVSVFESDGLTKYDPKYLLPFMEGVVNTYMHSSVELSDGRIGEIVMVNKTRLSKPVVKVDNDFIDTSADSSITIVRLV